MGKRDLTRRQFIATIAAGTGTVLMGNTLNAIPSASRPLMFDPLGTVTLGKTGIKTTLLGMGTGYSGYNRSSNITRAGVAESVIKAAYERGIRYFDCADSYGTHPFTKDALRGIPRENYVLGTKMWVTAGGIPEPERPDSSVVVDRFRKELNTDYIDILLLHCMVNSEWPDEYKRYMDDYSEAKQKGIVKQVGLSCHDFGAMKIAAENPWADVLLARINYDGAKMDGTPQDVMAVLKKAKDNGKGIIGMKIFGCGDLTKDEQRQKSLEYVIKSGNVDCMTIGMESIAQVDDTVERIMKLANS